jgi:signal transduction histidine kinase
MMKYFFWFILVIFSFQGLSQVICDCLETSINSAVTVYKDSISNGNLWENGVESNVPNLGVSETTWWVEFNIRSECEDQLFLTVQKPSLDSLTLLEMIDGKLSVVSELGDFVEINNRLFPTPNYIFQLPIEKHEMKSFVLKVRSFDQIQLPLIVSSSEQIIDDVSQQQMLFGLFSGVLFVMFFYNLFLFISTRDRSYLYYVIYILIVYLTQADIMGFAYQYIWPGCQNIERYSLVVLSSLVGLAAILFFNTFLNVKSSVPTAYRIIFVFGLLYALISVLSVIGFEVVAYQLLQINAGVLAMVLLITTVILLRKGSRAAGYFLIAWSVFLLGVCVYILKDFGVLPYNSITVGTMQMGSALEVILLSFALADRINQLKKDKALEQAARLVAIEENERIVREQNVFLESKVEERTLELRDSNTSLNQTLETLKSAQVQLVDAEKMASLGQMTAGIAHELNNPINFVSSNISPLKRDLNDVFEVLDKYELITPDLPNLSEVLGEIQELKEEIELEYVRKEINDLLNGIEDGANRTAEIVKGLRVFSRLDEYALKKANINDCLISTLLILESSMGSGVQVLRDLDDSIPEVNCYPGKLNQVFMNILVNAVQATKSNDKNLRKSKVQVISSQNEESIFITVEDNGIGMSEEVKTQIFDPFFTTKEVGEGTGLGLSIVLGIINDHQGKIQVESILGEGAKFLITLPKSL